VAAESPSRRPPAASAGQSTSGQSDRRDRTLERDLNATAPYRPHELGGPGRAASALLAPDADAGGGAGGGGDGAHHAAALGDTVRAAGVARAGPAPPPPLSHPPPLGAPLPCAAIR
jgi:hypothetical protein